MKAKPKSNILKLDEIRAQKKKKTIDLLKDSKGIALSISSHTCVICNTKKSCINKAGVCAYCYEHVLTPYEKKVADAESKHKIIKIEVIDDRWGK
jgi:hypothetical protein